METIKPFLNYPRHAGFEELLNSCGSMTKQLEALGHYLTVTLLAEEILNGNFKRYITLNLNEVPVVIACSHTATCNTFFYQLLKNASTTPIGKFLFSSQDNQVSRADNMLISQINTPGLMQQYPLIASRLAKHSYQAEQLFWQRQSVFTYYQEKLELIEIILPELGMFF